MSISGIDKISPSWEEVISRTLGMLHSWSDLNFLNNALTLNKATLIRINHNTLDDSLLNSMRKRLTAEESSRISRFRREKDQRRRTLSRGLVRTLLGMQYDCSHDEITLKSVGDGKPQCITPGGNEIDVNWSYSGPYIIIGINPSGKIGVDVEVIDKIAEVNELADLYLAVDEKDYLDADDGVSRFFEIWTRKEAILKWTGEGLNRKLNSFSVLGKLEASGWRGTIPWEIMGNTLRTRTIQFEDKSIISVALSGDDCSLHFIDMTGEPA